MKNRRISMMALFLCFAGIASKAQQVQKISLQQAIDLSIKNSGHLKISDAKIVAATAAVREAKDRQLPDASITGSYLRLSSANIDLKNTQPNSNAGSPKINQALYGIANVSLPIYAGGRIKYGIISAKYLEQAVRLNAEQDKEAIIFNSIEAYSNLYKASKTIAVIHENLAASLKRDSTFSRLEQNGLLARNDLLKAQLQSSNIELALLDAENNLNIATVNMNLMLGLPENTVLETDSNFVTSAQAQLAFSDLENLALHNRKDIQAIDFQKRAADLDIKSAKTVSYPTLALTGGYIAADIPKFVTITNAVNIGIGLQFNLSSLWKANTGLQQARAKQSTLMASAQLLDNAIRLAVNKDYQNYLLSQKKIEVYEKTISQASENYRITKNKYDNSLVSITDLLEADVSLLQAKLNVAVAKADAALAYHKLRQTTGTLSK